MGKRSFQDREDLAVHKQAVVPAAGHGLGLPEDQHVLKVEGVVPELELVVVPQAEAEGDAAAEEEGGPGFAGNAVKEQGQQRHRDGVEHQGLPVEEVAHQHPLGVGADGQHQQGQPHAQSRQGQQADAVGGVYAPLPAGPGGVRLPAEKKDPVPKSFQGITFVFRYTFLGGIHPFL